MKQILDIYRFVKLTEQVSREQALKEHPQQKVIWVGRSYHAPVSAPLRYRFAEKYHYSLQKADDICHDAVTNSYLDVSVEKGPKNKMDVLMVTTEGRELIEKILWIVPIRTAKRLVE